MEPEQPQYQTYDNVALLIQCRVVSRTTVGMLKMIANDCFAKLSPADCRTYYSTIDNFRRNINGFGKDTHVLTSSQINRIKIDLTEKTIGSCNKPTRQWTCTSVYPNVIDTLPKLVDAISIAETTNITELVRSYYNNIMYAGASIPDGVHDCLSAHGFDWSQLFFMKIIDKVSLIADLTIAMMTAETKPTSDVLNYSDVKPRLPLTPQQDLFRDIIGSMTSEISCNGYVSGLTNIIEAYYRMQDNGEIHGVNVIKLNAVLAKHNWAWGNGKTGFQKAPDVMFLLSDLQDIIDKL